MYLYSYVEKLYHVSGSPNTIVALAGNKADLLEARRVSAEVRNSWRCLPLYVDILFSLLFLISLSFTEKTVSNFVLTWKYSYKYDMKTKSLVAGSTTRLYFFSLLNCERIPNWFIEQVPDTNGKEEIVCTFSSTTTKIFQSPENW